MTNYACMNIITGTQSVSRISELMSYYDYCSSCSCLRGNKIRYDSFCVNLRNLRRPFHRENICQENCWLIVSGSASVSRIFLDSRVGV